MYEWLVAAVALSLLVCAAQAGQEQSDDATIRWDAGQLELETQAVLHRFDLEGGALRHSAWANRKSGADLLGGQAVPDFVLNVAGQPLSSADAGWTVGEPVVTRGKHGELNLSLVLERAGLQVTRHYVVHPGLSLVRGWLEIRNAGGAPVEITEPPVVTLNMAAPQCDLRWMSGAELFGDSWKMRTEPLPERKVFDSYDPPPTAAKMPTSGDGVEAWILHNDAQVWPAEGKALSRWAGDVQRHEVRLAVKAGDRISFVLGRRAQMTCDTTEWDPVIAYEGGESFQASAGFSTQQGQGGWRYRYLSDAGQWRELTYADVTGRYGERWRLDVKVLEPFVSATEMHPNPEGAAVREFTAPHDGTVVITGGLHNSGNQGPPGPGFRMGSMTYAPWLSVADRQTGASGYLGFDYMGHWRATVEGALGASVRVDVAGYHKALQPGEVVRTPYAFTGLFGSDLDDMGQEMLEWQYRYQWDYTREPWFPAVRMLGYWYKGTNWGSHGWVGGDPDYESTYRKVFRTADFMRAVGGDTYHRDWGWWDRAGDWNGPDFRSTGEYLRKYGMGQLIYAFIYTVDGESSVARAHPEWLANPSTLDQSMREVIEYEVDLLDQFYKRWGPYQWRNDSTPTGPRDGDDTVLLGQHQGFMEVLKRFHDTHPDCAFQGVNGGGMALDWEYLALSSGFQFTDGQAGAHACYDATYLFPPDKINNMPDIWDPDKYEAATWRGLLASNFDLTGDTFDPAKVEGIRDIIDVYHYLQSRGVVGRWVRVYHPTVTGDAPEMYLQRLSWDHQRGLILTKHLGKGTVVVHPKGLIPELDYDVCFHESREQFVRSGASLMAEGITMVDPAAGELIYLNLSDHPGNTLDKTPPTAPGVVMVREGRNMGVPGVEVSWQPGADDHWLSHYTIWRDGVLLEKVAKGCFYFDHSAGADPAAVYAVCSVDGSGNVSEASVAKAANQPRRVLHDSAGLPLQGEWASETFGPAHLGSLACATGAGARLELQFTGSAVTVHSRLGAEGGLARVSVDGGEPETVSCFSADEIPGWPIFEKRWAGAGEHVLALEVLGERDPYSAGSRVWLDAVTVEP